jgi:hypothetical protein
VVLLAGLDKQIGLFTASLEEKKKNLGKSL